MNANDYAYGFAGSNPDNLTDDLVDHLKTDEGKADLKILDDHWQEVTRLAERYGFIVSAHGGVATICTHHEFVEQLGIEREASRLRTERVELGGDAS